MKYLALYLFLFICRANVIAQNASIDSIDRLISKATSDTQRINLAIKKINLLNEVNIDSSIQLCRALLKGAEKINYQKGIVEIRQDISSNYSRKGKYDSAFYNLQIAEHISASLKDSLLLTKTYSAYGMMYGMQGKYDTSMDYYQKSIGIDERNGFTKLLGSAYGNLAIGYQMLSNFPEALLYQQKSLRLSEQNNDLVSQAYTLMNLGNTYENIGDTAKSESTFLKGIELAKNLGIKSVELYGYSNMATLYDSQKKYGKSYDFAMKSASLAKVIGDAGIQSASLSKAASALAYLDKFNDAVHLGEYAIIVADSSAQPFNIFQSYTTMGNILRLQKKYKEAIPFFEKGFGSIKDADLFDESTSAMYAALSDCYEQTGNYRKALETFRMAAKINDSTRSKSNVQKTTELSMNYEFEKKQREAQAIQDRKNSDAKSKQTLLIVGLGLTLIIAALAWRAFYNKKRANALLHKQKEELQITLSRLNATQAQLIQSEKMASLGELTAGIAHEIQNPLNFVNNFSEINKELIGEMKTEIEKGNIGEVKSIAGDIEANEEKINHHGRRADAIVKGMLQHSRSSTGVKEPVDINALADEYLRLSYHGLRAKDKSFNADIKTDFDTTIGKINVVTQDVGRVLLNLYNNAFYAVTEKMKSLNREGFQNPEGFAYKPTVTVNTKKSGNQVIISVSDNGNGIPKKVVDKIFQPFFTTKPTGEGTGLGLSLSYDVIKAHGGEIKVESPPAGEAGKEGEGALFVILLPA